MIFITFILGYLLLKFSLKSLINHLASSGNLTPTKISIKDGLIFQCLLLPQVFTIKLYFKFPI